MSEPIEPKTMRFTKDQLVTLFRRYLTGLHGNTPPRLMADNAERERYMTDLGLFYGFSCALFDDPNEETGIRSEEGEARSQA